MADNKPNIANKSMKTPLMISGAIHVVVVLLVIFGLPHFMKEPEEITSIPVEMISDISDMTTTNKPPVKAPKPKEEKPEEKPLPKKEPPKPTPPKKEITPPDPEELKEPPKKEAVEKDDLAPPKPKQEKKPEKKPEPKKPEKKPEKQEDNSQDMEKLLNDLTKSEPPQPEATEDAPDEPANPTPSPVTSAFADKMSMSEMDALRQQLADCWNINPGLMNAQDLAVEVRIMVNRDKTVSSAKVVDQGRYNSDTFFRTMADSALRAVQNPRCSPLRLPEDKYNLWKDMTIVFDPKQMF